MECGLQWKDITCWDCAGHGTVTHEETVETAIPEYCPDLGRIVETAGQVLIRSRTGDGKTVTISGAVKVTVLYTSEESVGLRSLTQTVPFTCTAQELLPAACQVVWVTGRLLLCEAQALTARRLYLRLIPELTLTGWRCSVLRLCGGVAEENDALRLKYHRREVCLTASVAERECSVTQDAPVPAGQPVPEDLLCSRLYPRITGCQPVGTKLMVKGELFLSALYRCREQQLYTYEVSLPFSQVVELPEGAGQGDCTAETSLSGGEVRLLRGEDTGGFAVTADLRLLLTTNRTETVECLTDLYSTRCDTKVETQEVTLPTASMERPARQETVEHLDFGRRRPFVFVTDSDCVPTPAGDDGDLRAAVRLRLLYLDEEETPTVTERTAEVPLGGGARSGCGCTLAGAPEVVLGGSGCDLRQTVELRRYLPESETLTTVTAVEVVEDGQTGRRPSLVMRRLAEGETLWDVAKRYHTDEALIRTVNHLEGETPPEKMLLIPRMR